MAKIKIDTKRISSALDAAKRLGAKNGALVTCKHGTFYVTTTVAGSFISLLDEEKQSGNAVIIANERLEKAIYRTKQVTFEVQSTSLQIFLKGSRINLVGDVTEGVEARDLVVTTQERWEDRGQSRGSANLLGSLLRNNASHFTIKNHVEDNKPVIIHIRWGKEFIQACMSDRYHGVYISRGNTSGGSKSIYVYSSWMPLLLAQLTDNNAAVSITEREIKVSNDNALLTLTSIVPEGNIISIDMVQKLLEGKGLRNKVNGAELSSALTRSLAVLTPESAVQLSVKEGGGAMLVSGSDSSGSKIQEKIALKSEKTMAFGIKTLMYNVQEVVPDLDTDIDIIVASRALLFSIARGDKDDDKAVYTITSFSATT